MRTKTTKNNTSSTFTSCFPFMPLLILFVTFVTTKGPLKSVPLKNFWHYGAMPEIKFIRNHV
jgi:hypothetical protein